MNLAAITDPALHEVRQAYRSGELVLFVGAGLSEAAGLPSRAELVGMLRERARARGAKVEVLNDIDALATGSIKALSAARAAVGESDFNAFVREKLDDRTLVKKLPDLALAIGELGPRLRTVLTTNLDDLLERSFHGEWSALHRATAGMAREENVILKLHGTLRDPQTWVLTQDQYERAMYNDARRSEGIAAIFATRPILFVGHAFDDDDDLEHHFGRTRALAGGQAPRHFALVPDASIAPFGRTLREAGGVRLIGYPNADRRHGEVPGILRWLAEPERASTVRPSVDPGVLPLSEESPRSAPSLPPSPDEPYDPNFYIHRPEEEKRAFAKLAKAGTPVVLWGPKLSGKSTLLRYLVESKKRHDARDGTPSLFLEVDLSELLLQLGTNPTPDGLLERFARSLRTEARIDDDSFDKIAARRHSWSDKLIELMEDHVLKAAACVVLVVKRADAAWGRNDIQAAFYGALRKWKERAHQLEWKRLRFVLLLSKTPALVFEDSEGFGSPFSNIAIDVIELSDLTLLWEAQIYVLSWLRSLTCRTRWSRDGAMALWTTRQGSDERLSDAEPHGDEGVGEVTLGARRPTYERRWRVGPRGEKPVEGRSRRRRSRRELRLYDVATQGTSDLRSDRDRARPSNPGTCAPFSSAAW